MTPELMPDLMPLWLPGWLPHAVLPWAPVLLALLGALVLAAIPVMRWSAWVQLGFAALGLPLVALLLWLPPAAEGLLRADALNLPLLAVAALAGLGAALGTLLLPLPEGAGRSWAAGCQALLGLTHLALLADDMALAWMALTLASLVLALLVALRRGAAALSAAWKALLLCGAGALLALLGTLVLAMAAAPLAGEAALSFQTLLRVGREAEGGLLTLGFVLLLAGYGVLAGLVPLQLWLPDAQGEGPTPLLVIPCALLGNAALLAVLRGKAVAALNPLWLPPGLLLLAAGLLSLGYAGWALWRAGDAGRLLAGAALGQTGLAAFAFGLGGPAVTAGLLQMLGATLALAAAGLGLGRASLLRQGAVALPALSGLAASEPRLGWALAAVLAALAGLPPLALFVGEFLLLQQAVARLPWLALPLAAGLVALAVALLARLRGLCFGPAPAGPVADPAWQDAMAPPPLASGGAPVFWLMLLHLLALLALGLFLPPAVAALLADAARLAG